MIRSDQANGIGVTSGEGHGSGRTVAVLLGLPGFEVVCSGPNWPARSTSSCRRARGERAAGVRGDRRAATRRAVRVRDLSAGGRPIVLEWRKRVWRCVEPACAQAPGRRTSELIALRAVLESPRVDGGSEATGG